MAEDPSLFDNTDARQSERIGFDKGLTLTVSRTLRGGMGLVHLGTLENSDETLLATKTLQKRFLLDPVVRGAYENELSIWASIGAAFFVLPLLGVWRADGMPYAVSLAAVDDAGQPKTVRTLLDRSPDGLTPRKTLEIAICVAIGMRGASA